jgi:uncharacterized protein (DUF305 family)
MQYDQGTARRAARLLLAAALAACTPGGDERAGADSAAAGDSAGAMAGMQHDSGMAGMAGAESRPAARDSNQSFLRMMSDHHEGLIAMADSADDRAQGATAKADARKLLQKQKEEQSRMMGMLRRQYGDSITPMIMPSNRAMLDSTVRATGAALDPTFYRQVIHHHREGMGMIDRYMPTLSGEVKRMAEQMSGEQAREITEFERKAGAARGA